MTQFKFIFQPPYSIMIGAEVFLDSETRKIDGFCLHLLLISLEVSWSENDNDFFNLT